SSKAPRSGSRRTPPPARIRSTSSVTTPRSSWPADRRWRGTSSWRQRRREVYRKAPGRRGTGRGQRYCVASGEGALELRPREEVRLHHDVDGEDAGVVEAEDGVVVPAGARADEGTHPRRQHARLLTFAVCDGSHDGAVGVGREHGVGEPLDADP